MGASKTRVALISAGLEFYRRYLLEQLSEHYDVWLISDEPLSWQEPYLSGHTKIESYSAETLVSAITAIPESTRPKGLVCWDERYVIATADAAQRLGLPSAGADGIRGCRDKALSRQRLSTAGLRQPRSKLCFSISEARSFAQSLGFPLVVKPRAMGASIGVALVRTEQELTHRFDEASQASRQGAEDFRDAVIVEEFISGPEISIDGRVVNGQYEPLFVARKRVGLPPHFEEIGHLVRFDDPLLADETILSGVRSAHRAIRFENGITHTELKLTADGPVIIEINGRLGGDLIPFLATCAIGLQPGRIAGAIAVGEATNLEERPLRRAAAIHFRYPERDLTVARIRLPDPVQDTDPEGACVALAGPGTRLALPPTAYAARAAYAIAVGHDPTACIALSEHLAAQVKIDAADEPRTNAERATAVVSA
jgi:biotin carboxylase